MNEEKRRYVRVETMLYVTLSDGKRSLKKLIHDASPGGLLIESDDPWEAGTVLGVVIDTRVPIKAKGRVVWVKKDELTYKMGVEFEDLDSDAAREWIDFLFHFQELMVR
ncbi:MAG: PilZ domain-containing protein [Deltaproteobacteria bacterium]|nr:PilZ domain-containing protein [Deltaproteobacteria bacterium]